MYDVQQVLKSNNGYKKFVPNILDSLTHVVQYFYIL
jgi:hypothetical protein